jgi:colanic acid biosynthesis glycosyl transferase WcaI
MRIHLVTNLFAPDELAGAALFADLALFLRAAGHDLRVTTTYAYYPAWRVDPDDARHEFRDEVWRGVPVRRVRMYVPARPSGARRLLSDASFLTALLRHGRHPGWTPEVVLTACPMLSQCTAQRALYPGKGVPCLIVVQDFVVDAALELGILRLPGLAGPLRRLERWSLRSAKTLATISESMLEKLREIAGPDRRFVFLPNWIHASLADEIARQRPAASARSPGRLLYCGNLGVKQGLGDVVAGFARVGTGWNLHIHGDGGERETLASTAGAMSSVRLGGVLSETDYVRELLTCSACLVTQMPGAGANFLPSKLLPALAARTPVLAVADPASPLGREVSAGGFGSLVAPGDAEGLRKTLTAWQADPALLVQLSARAEAWGARYNRETTLARYAEELQRLVNPGALLGATNEATR